MFWGFFFVKGQTVSILSFVSHICSLLHVLLFLLTALKKYRNYSWPVDCPKPDHQRQLWAAGRGVPAPFSQGKVVIAWLNAPC